MAYDATNRKQQSLATRQKIFQIAIALTAEKNLSDISVDQIVAHASVAKGSFYLHFSSKDALYVAIVNHYMKAVNEDYLQSVENAPTDSTARSRILTLVQKITHVLGEQIGCENIKTVYKAQLSNQLHTDSMTSHTLKLWIPFRQLFEGGMQSGEFPPRFSADALAENPCSPSVA